MQPSLAKKVRPVFLPVVPSPSEALQTFSAVIISGGSSGIGKSIIGLCLELKPDLVICNLSRRPPPENISPNSRKFLNHFSCDLADSAAVEEAVEAVSGFLDRTVPAGRILLINNSGFGSFGEFLELDLDQELRMVDVNVRAMVALTGQLRPLLRARGGAVMNIASTLAFQPAPYSATYAAGKAFVLHWTLALNEEWRGSTLRALAVCPGTTRTAFFRTAGVGDGAVTDSVAMTSDDVARAALAALADGRAVVVTGWKNKLLVAASSVLPKPWQARIVARVLARRRPIRGNA